MDRPSAGRALGTVRSRFAVIAVAVAAVLLITGMVGVAIGAESTPDYGVRTARLNEGERPGSTFDHAVEAGTSVKDAAEIFNFTDETMVFDVYSTDMVPLEGGGLTAASRQDEVTGTGLWVDVSTDTVEVAPRDSVLVPFTISVPVGTPPGDHAAAVMVELQTAPSGGSIESRTRIGIRVLVEVIGEVNLEVVLGDLTSERLGNVIRYRLVVQNTGDVTFEANAVAAVVGWRGETRVEMPFDPAGVFVAPGEQVVLVADWTDPPFFGRFDATASVQATIGDRDPVEFVSGVLTVWIIPWAFVAIIVIAVLLLAWLVYNRRGNIKAWRDRRRDERAMLKDYRQQRDA